MRLIFYTKEAATILKELNDVKWIEINKSKSKNINIILFNNEKIYLSHTNLYKHNSNYIL
jgi:hypothetical protein